MQYIKKTGTPQEAQGKKVTKSIVDSCWCGETRQYVDLFYDRSRMRPLGPILIQEQSDPSGNSYCCYCMRRLFLTDTEDGHKANVTFEHIIPHNIQHDAWILDRENYVKFPNLRDDHIIVCFEGKLSEEQRTVRMVSMPYPHYVSYHNIVASCDGSTFESNRLEKCRCCNNRRQERFVMPIYLSKEKARISENRTLRQDIIDDIDSANEISSWVDNDAAWNLLSEYCWFYQYYKLK